MHPTDKDYFNRAQRAEQEAQEWRTVADQLADALEEQVGECLDERCEMCARHETTLSLYQKTKGTE